jgi:peptidoglycan-associated lipoprotein
MKTMRPFIARRAGFTLAALAVVACGRKPQPQLPVAEPATPPPASPVQPSAEDEARRAREREEARLREEIARLRSSLEQMVFFDYDRAEVRLDSRGTLDAKVPILRERPDIRLRIEGHADERGSAEYNLALGLRRAQNVRTYIANFGIDASRIDVVTIGEERPLSTGTDEASYARNRRAEFRIMAGLATASPDTQR